MTIAGSLSQKRKVRRGVLTIRQVVGDVAAQYNGARCWGCQVKFKK